VIVPRGRESGSKGAVRRAVLRSPFKGTVLVFSLDRLAIIEARHFGRRQDADTGRAGATRFRARKLSEDGY